MSALDELRAATGKPSTSTTKQKGTKEEAEGSAPSTFTKTEAFKALEAVEKALNAQFKTTNSLVRLNSKKLVITPNTPTGIPSFDYGALGIGGIPKGRIIEVFGPESSGKTTITLQIIAEFQKNGLAAFIDAEHALDPNYAKALGVNLDELILSQPDSGEQALETAEALVDSRAVNIIAIDSVAALVPQAELDGEMGDSHMGLQARLMSQAMRKLTAKCDKNGVTIIFINQLREKLGVMFGNPETTTGGKALKFYSSVRIDVRRIGGANGKIMSGDVEIGYRMKLKVVKNKVAAPFKEAIVDNIYGIGVDKFADTVRFAVEVGAIEKSGSWLSFQGERLSQGTDNAVLTLRDNPALMDKVKLEIDKAIKAQQEVV